MITVNMLHVGRFGLKDSYFKSAAKNQKYRVIMNYQYYNVENYTQEELGLEVSCVLCVYVVYWIFYC